MRFLIPQSPEHRLQDGLDRSASSFLRSFSSSSGSTGCAVDTKNRGVQALASVSVVVSAISLVGGGPNLVERHPVELFWRSGYVKPGNT